MVKIRILSSVFENSCKGRQRAIIFIICLFLFQNSFAQDSVSTGFITEQLWIDYNYKYLLKDNYTLYGDVGYRVVTPYIWNRFFIRPSINYQIPKRFKSKLFYSTDLHAGIGIFFTDNKSESNRFEIRPFQGYSLTWPNRPLIKIIHYVRLEERFDMRTQNWDNTFGLRLRYQASLILLFSGRYIKINKGLYLPASIELFWNLIGVNQFNDAVRIVPGVGYRFSDFWKAEMNFGYHYTRNTIEEDFATNDFVLRIRIFHTLGGNQRSSEDSENEISD